MSIIDSLQWRSAIKKFDPDKKVSQNDLEKILEATNLSASSGGLQPFKVVVVSNEELKSHLKPSTYGQSQVEDASHVLVFAIETEIDERTVEAFMKRISEVRDVELKDLEGYSNSMKNYVHNIPHELRGAWAKNQAYIALGTTLTAAAEMKIDTCPMEGFNPEEYQKILSLEKQNLMPVVILPIGYRSEEEAHAGQAKVRKSKENFIVEIV